ncbi:uncharacterized protein LOC131014661 [Salvia miltiorrhiza]|uniref:uncharacterized protein LOC131014661 n=1 Tax=Salvia miltiorrhiza TaxID=226208 RepID=UPI0025AC8C62|nr:uncharacterized protein LOC131014661 [Salvia miltiorrhiza]
MMINSNLDDQLQLSVTMITIILILSLLFFETGDANCTPSACGIIRNISSPFRLKGDPNHCGDPRFELACEDNVTFVYQNSHKYYVKEINYGIARIRVVDASINNNSICSFPTYTFITDDESPYRTFSHHSYPYNGYTASPIFFISCPNQLSNSSLFTDITDCASNSSLPTPRYDYIKVGRMEKPSEVPHRCTVDVVAFTSSEFKDSGNVSLSEIHQSLLYGFELYVCSWWWCRRTTSNWGTVMDFHH